MLGATSRKKYAKSGKEILHIEDIRFPKWGKQMEIVCRETPHSYCPPLVCPTALGALMRQRCANLLKDHSGANIWHLAVWWFLACLDPEKTSQSDSINDHPSKIKSQLPNPFFYLFWEIPMNFQGVSLIKDVS